jgi:hypothetical protein
MGVVHLVRWIPESLYFVRGADNQYWSVVGIESLLALGVLLMGWRLKDSNRSIVLAAATSWGALLGPCAHPGFRMLRHIGEWTSEFPIAVALLPRSASYAATLAAAPYVFWSLLRTPLVERPQGWLMILFAVAAFVLTFVGMVTVLPPNR